MVAATVRLRAGKVERDVLGHLGGNDSHPVTEVVTRVQEPLPLNDLFRSHFLVILHRAHGQRRR